METGKSTFSEMLKGFGSMGDAADFAISKVQAFQVLIMITVVLLYKLLILPWRGSKKKQMFDELDKLRNMTVTIPRKNVSRDGGKDDFLTEEKFVTLKKMVICHHFSWFLKIRQQVYVKRLKTHLLKTFKG
ncbi:hypothetical protein ACJJI4_06890 [Microbulbifer sp. TRSA002]|uniref:hypothetical protein n=1 Tax=Microbulbifer sp. TRSA002 TaxID=3243382 RepID=UPI00403A32EC